MSIHRVNGINHLLWLRIADWIKFMATPCIFFPVIPILYDIINRNLPLAELLQRISHLILSMVMLPTLPESHRPLRHNWRLARQGAITTDYLIHILACDKVIVDLWIHLAPPRLFCLLFLWHRIVRTETKACCVTIRIPLDTDWHPFLSFQMSRKLIVCRVPCLTEAFFQHQLIVQINLCITSGIQIKEIVTRSRWFYFPFVSDQHMA